MVVDNDSRDGTLETLAREAPGVRVIANRENVGYARAVNQGLAATAGDFALVLNPDCEVQPGALRALLDHAAAHPRAGLAGPDASSTPTARSSTRRARSPTTSPSSSTATRS